MNPKEYGRDFKPWYDKQKDLTDWNFKEELHQILQSRR
jgi:hypothetical protein